MGSLQNRGDGGPADLPKPDWGRFTRNGSKIYAHLFEAAVSAYCLPPLNGTISQMCRLYDGGEVRKANFWTLMAYKDWTFFSYIPMPRIVTRCQMRTIQ